MMKNRYFKGFNHLFGRARKSAAQRLKERLNEIRGRAPGQLHSLFAEVVESEKIAGANGCRERHYPADVTFWAMLGQVFRGGSLRDAVREIQASVCAADFLARPKRWLKPLKYLFFIIQIRCFNNVSLASFLFSKNYPIIALSECHSGQISLKPIVG